MSRPMMCKMRDSAVWLLAVGSTRCICGLFSRYRPGTPLTVVFAVPSGYTRKVVSLYRPGTPESVLLLYPVDTPPDSCFRCTQWVHVFRSRLVATYT